MPILRRRPNSGRLCIGSGDISSGGCTEQCFNCNDDDDVDELDKLATELIDDGCCDFRSSNSGILWPKLSCPCSKKKEIKNKKISMERSSEWYFMIHMQNRMNEWINASNSIIYLLRSEIYEKTHLIPFIFKFTILYLCIYGFQFWKGFEPFKNNEEMTK